MVRNVEGHASTIRLTPCIGRLHRLSSNGITGRRSRRRVHNGRSGMALDLLDPSHLIRNPTPTLHIPSARDAI